MAEICRRLDGLPLAIELAAAHLRLFSPEVLRDRLGNRLGLLRNGPRDLPERQQTLRATMDWSYELLRPGEQRLFELLAVFAESAIGAVEAVVAELGPIDDIAVDVLDGLAGLVEKSLVRLVDAPGGEPRVAMLETIREFATDRLERTTRHRGTRSPGTRHLLRGPGGPAAGRPDRHAAARLRWPTSAPTPRTSGSPGRTGWPSATSSGSTSWPARC